MSATQSNLQLEGYFLKQLTYDLKEGMVEFPKGSDELEPVDFAVIDTTNALDDELHRWRCELVVESVNDNQPYDFKIVMVGFFSVNPDLDEDVRKLIAQSNCPAVLYSTAREIVATVTRRSPYPGTLLPLVTFIKQPEKEKNAAARTSPRAGKKPVKK